MMICKLEIPFCDVIYVKGFGLNDIHPCWNIFIQFSLQPRTKRRVVSGPGPEN